MTIDLTQRLCDATIGTLDIAAYHTRPSSPTNLTLHEALDGRLLRLHLVPRIHSTQVRLRAVLEQPGLRVEGPLAVVDLHVVGPVLRIEPLLHAG